MRELLKTFLHKKSLLIIIPLVIAFFLLVGSTTQQPSPSTTVPSPTKTPSDNQGFPGVITAAPTPFYDQEATKRLTDRLDKQVPLSRTNQEAKQAIINQLNKNSGIVQQTDVYTIEYVKSADMFMVEINTADVGLAKTQVTTWFTANGFAAKAVCELPVVFYLNFDVSQQLQSEGRTFSPLGEGC